MTRTNRVTRTNPSGTRTSPSGTHRIRNLGVFALAALLALVFSVTPAGADPKLRCGSPTKNGGSVTITINLKRGDEIHPITLRDISFGRGYPAADKADFIAQLINRLEDPNHDFITATHADGSDEVQLHGESGWSIDGHAIG